jgi:flagellin-like hook-associated protein FlgL
MRIISSDSSGASVQLSSSELRMLNNAMNETLEALDNDDEFSTRVGAERSEMSSLLDELHKLIVNLPAS